MRNNEDEEIMDYDYKPQSMVSIFAFFNPAGFFGRFCCGSGRPFLMGRQSQRKTCRGFSQKARKTGALPGKVSTCRTGWKRHWRGS